MESLDAKIADLRVKIEIEQKCKDGAENMLHNLKDPSAVQQCELNVRESQRRLDFLSGEMTKLLAKRQNATGVSGSVDEIAASVESFSKSTPGSAMGSGNVAGPVQGQGLGQGQGPGQPQNQFRDWNATANSMWPNGSTDDNSLRPPSLGRMLDKRNSDPGLSITNYYNQMSRTTSPPSISNTSYPSSRMSVAGYPTSSGADRPPLTPEHHTRSTGRLSMTAAMLGNLFHVIGRTRSGSASPRSGSSSASSLPGLVGEAVGQGRDAVTQFDYMKCSTPITSAKVKFKLSEVRHKLDVEQQIRAGTERMKAALVEASQKAGSASTASLDSAGGSGNGDRKMHSEVDEKMAESNAKVALLVKAEQRYRGLYVETEEEAGGANSLRSSDSRSSLTATNDSETGALIPSASSASLSSLHVPIPPARKPLTGRLKLRLVGTSGLPGKKSHRSDTYVVVRIDGVQRAKTKTSKGSKWSEEFDIRVEKGVEVEVAVYEKGGTVLALCWWKMSDLEEELKVSAGARDSMLGKDGLIVGPSAGVLPDGEEAVPGREIVATGGLSDGIETWLDLEPAGQILAKINFGG
ncbi:Serine/threonine kinase [Rhizophlyctis rosea]|uniref:Serine/threonine kinase n=1 Tax=Rhizophlyctis rosea TaxID=64517 RepID=A0AAD5SK97_9FUNG|nr:Serine/threonine kinase [Rhizophlyctis rosea]